MRESFRYLTVGLSLVIVAGCSDTSTAPRAAKRVLSAAPASAFDLTGTSLSYGDQSTDFVVTWRGGSFSLPYGTTVDFPQNSVCATSSTYGATEWDAPCTVLRPGESVRIHATIRLTTSGLAVDFSPQLRFAPETQVPLSTDFFAPWVKANASLIRATPSLAGFLAMDYSSALGGDRVADYVSDPSLVTHVDLSTGRVWRRVKHFSGYNVTTGEPCEPSPDNPDCIEIDGDGGGK
jgi:hypothetical protein